MREGDATHPTGMKPAPFRVNFCPAVLTKPVALGGNAVVVDAVVDVVVDATVDVVVDTDVTVAVELAAPGRHSESNM